MLRNTSEKWLLVGGIFFLVIIVAIILIAMAGKSRVVVINNIASSTATTGQSNSHATTTAASTTDPSYPIPDVMAFATSSSLTPLTPAEESTYDASMLKLANLPIVTRSFRVSSTLPGTTTLAYHIVTVTLTAVDGWPAKNAPYPDEGALLPSHRIVAYYGNLYSTQMGALGEYPAPQMLAMLQSTTAMWAAADPSTPVIPALDYIVVSAQASPGPDGKYRDRMPDSQVQEILQMAQQVNGLVFLDVQVGLSNVETEVPLLEKYLALPNVELSLDPEFDMHNGEAPGTVIGTMDASDINWAADYLANIVVANNLPPKILVVHRFTDDMVTNTSEIKPLPEVQIVMDMDGFGFPAKKINTYEQVIVPYPVQFTGFKLFYKNDAAGPMGALMTPAEVLKLSPQPSYIQYQ